jgi:hypothetical protein
MNFRRWLNESQQNQLRQLRDMLPACALSNEKDLVKWTWEKSGTFSVKSMYKHLFSLDINNPNKKPWEAKIPMKVKIFMWLICANAILTKDNLSRKNWQGDKRCFSAMFLKALNACSLTVTWLDTSGVLLHT